MGGNVNTVSEIMEAKYFRPNYHKRNVIAVRLLAAFETGYGGKVIPPFSRFYLGGEDTLRGFDIRTVSPVVFVPTLTSTPVSFLNPTRLDGGGNPTTGTVNIPTLSYQTSFPGGDTELVGNFEYRIPLFPHVGLSIFGDAGATGAIRSDQLQLNSTDFTTLVQQFPGTTIDRTLQFQPGTNFKPRTSAGLELVIQLPIVQAPFRIYWAYNFNRMSEVITAPLTQFPGPIGELTTPCPTGSTPGGQPPPCPWAIYKAQVPLTEIWNSQVAPQIINLFNNPQRTNFFDPVRTFRFTVSRTF
jgi:outer membrane protein insertion porin family